jgi:predicted N-acyltransferase
VEFTAGKNEGLNGLRDQVLGEIPIYRKARSDFRYVLRGVWNDASSQNGRFFEAAVLVEFPFEALEHPSSFRDLIPFIK